LLSPQKNPYYPFRMEQQALDYDSCAQILAKLDADAQHPQNDNLTSSDSPAGDPSGLSPFNSASPPGLSSGSVTSHSPESLRFEWDPNDPSAFFDDISEAAGILPDGGNWDQLMLPEQVGVPPMSGYIKSENEQPPAGYFGESGDPQGTISPGRSLLDPTVQTAFEGGPYPFPKDSDALFNFAYNNQPPSRQNSGDFSPMIWRTQTQQRDDFQAQTPEWQQQIQQPQQQQQQQQMRPHQLPPTPQRQSPLRQSVSSPHSVSSPDSRDGSASDDGAPAPPRTKKRKTSSEEGSEGNQQPGSTASGGSRKQPKKTAHNMIEKRYRTNLNDKIAALRDSVPSLRVMAGTARLGDDDEEVDLEGLAPAHKLNKATVLAKATEYIRHLEKRNKRLLEENDQLKNRLNAFEKLATMGGMGLQAQPGQHPGRGGAAGGPGGGLVSRLMVGGLAGLMVVGGLRSHEGGSHHQLAALPIPVQWLGVGAPSANTHLALLIAKLLLLFTAILYVVTPGYFDAKETPLDAKAVRNPNVSTAPSLASPLKNRCHAWLTAIQTVWVPRHSVTLELAALGQKAIKLSLRKMIGWERYRTITGMTEEDEAARIKSWTIALDAQLTGGDLSVNHSRLLLTLLASWTLPATPARLMVNSLHIRVLFFDLGSHLQLLAEKFSNFYWTEARKAHEKAVLENDPSAEQLPENLLQLLQLDPSDVFDPVIVENAYNLAYNKLAQTTADEGMDSVVKDAAIASPLDALAAWLSSLLLQGALSASLKTNPSPSLVRRIQNDLDTALRIAPLSSAVQLRALTAKAVLVSEDGEKYLYEAIKIFDEDMKSREQVLSQKPGLPRVAVTPINTAFTTTADIRVSLRCGMALALMRNGSHDQATRLFSDLDWQRQADRNCLGFLGFVAAWKTLTTFVHWDEDWATDAGESVRRAAAMLRIWVSDKRIRKLDVSRADCVRVVDFCNKLQKKLAGLETDGDDGYVSGELGSVTPTQSNPKGLPA